MKPFYLFDEKCPLCVRFKMAIEKILPDQINAISLYDEEIYQSYPELDPEKCQEEIHLMTSERQVLRGGEAISYLTQLHPKVAKFSWLIESNVGQKTSDFFYDSLNQLRQSLKKKCPKCKNKQEHRRSNCRSNP